MRFRLIESPAQPTTKAEWPPSSKTLDAFDRQKSLQQQKDFLAKHILPHPIFRNLFGIRPIIIHSMMIAGLDPQRNKFLDFVCKIPFKMPDAKTYKGKMQYLYDSYNNKKIDIKSNILLPILYNESLWSRSLEDFRYTLNAFNMFSQPSLYKSYLKDTNKNVKVSISQFINGDEIKPAGIDGRPGDTIYNQIEEWAKDNEYTFDEIQANKQKAEKEEAKKNKSNKDNKDEKGNVTINKGITNVKWNYEYFKTILENVFANSSDFKTELTKNDYLERVFVTFDLSNLTPGKVDSTIESSATNTIKDEDVKQFGDPHKIDIPIFLNANINGETIPGVYLFHKFISLEDRFISLYEQTSKKNLGNLKRHLAKVNPDNVTDVNILYQSVIDALNELSPIPHR